MKSLPTRVSAFLLTVVFIFGATGIAAAVAAPERRIDFEPDQLVIRIRGDAEPFRVLKYPVAIDVAGEAKLLQSRFDLEYAEPNFIARALFVPNDAQYKLQWNFDNPLSGGIDTEEAWDLAQGEGVTVAVVDTGVAYENYEESRRGPKYVLAPDLAGTLFVPGYDFVNNDAHPNDDNGHGTHVAGTIAGSTNNKVGVAGIAFAARLMPVKVLDRTGVGTYANIARGIRFAVDSGATIINLSLGGAADSITLRGAVSYARDRGATLIAAAGNDAENFVSYPAAYDDAVIAVGATRIDQARAAYSNYGASLDVVAPGGDLRVDQNNDGYSDGILQQTFQRNPARFGYYFFQGTSMAAAHVSGVAALVSAYKATTSPLYIREALERTAEDLGAPGVDPEYGNGLINALRALQY
ncbi:MAG: S8 family peptidase [bacterium]|nr:S8 family peptidase [bacterium]MDZ4296406.1 S8 family peptidase [Patescibacteria group bacterium]